MTTTELFTRLGFLVEEDFFDNELRLQLLRELRESPCRPAEVYGSKTGFVLKPQARKAGYVGVSAETAAMVVDRLMAIKVQVEAHFSVTLRTCQPPYFLHYEPGDFFELHTDRNTDPNAIEPIRHRLVSIVIFLNEQVPDGGSDGTRVDEGTDTYSGGDLTFLTHLGVANNAPLKVPFRGRAGSLVAFPSLVAHEVRPVTHGDRYTIVSWFAD